MTAGRFLLAAFCCALCARLSHAYVSQETPAAPVLSISQQQEQAAAAAPKTVDASTGTAAAASAQVPTGQAASAAPQPKAGAANDEADPGRQMFDGAGAGGGTGGASTSLSGMGAAAAAATKGAGKAPGDKSGTQAAEPASSAAAAPQKGLVVPEIPQPVQVAAPVTQQTGNAAWWKDWTSSVKGWAGETWNGIRQGVTDLAKEMVSLFSSLGDRFKNAFMSVWNAMDTVTLGTVSHGRLVNGIQMPNIDTYGVRNPAQTFGSKHMVLGLMYVGGKVKAAGGPPMRVGDISNPKGGQIDSHKSHQNGLDVDIYFYYVNGRHDTLWNFRVLQGLCRNPYFEPTIIFVSPRVKSMLLFEARRQGDGEVGAWASRILNVSEPGHDDHYHLRISPTPKQPAVAGVPGKN